MFRDRLEAGRRLAARLSTGAYVRPIVLALPRGGVPVAVEIAKRLHAPLDLILVRKIGVPFQPELAAAAIVDGDPLQVVLNPPVLRAAGLDPEDLCEDIARETREITRRRKAYLKDMPHVDLEGRTVIVVDDGIATGTTIRAALQALRRQNPLRIVLAVPVAARDMLDELAPLVEEIVCLEQPEPFHAVGMHYSNFHQLTDAEVIAGLHAAAAANPRAGRDRTPAASTKVSL